MLYPLFKLHIPVLRLQLAVLWGAFLVIQFIISAVMLLLRPEESILISGTLLPFAGGFILFALTQRLVLVDFQNGVRMGRTRRKMLGLTLALIGADALLVSLSALLLCLTRMDNSSPQCSACCIQTTCNNRYSCCKSCFLCCLLCDSSYYMVAVADLRKKSHGNSKPSAHILIPYSSSHIKAMQTVSL